MGRPIDEDDLSGRNFAGWTVVGPAGFNEQREKLWYCYCKIGDDLLDDLIPEPALFEMLVEEQQDNKQKAVS